MEDKFYNADLSCCRDDTSLQLSPSDVSLTEVEGHPLFYYRINKLSAWLGDDSEADDMLMEETWDSD